jgi:hypothetical protein
MAADAGVDTLAPALIWAGHLLFAGREGVPPEAGAVRKMVITVIASVCKNGSPHGQAAPGDRAPVVMYAGACRGESRRWFPVPATEKDV